MINLQVNNIISKFSYIIFCLQFKNNDCKCSKIHADYIYYYSIVHIFITALMFIVPKIF